MLLKSSSIVRSTGPRTLFLIGAMVTIAVLLWMHQMRLSGASHGLAPIFFVLFAYSDYPGGLCALIVLLVAIFGPRYLSARRIAQWAGDHPFAIAAVTAPMLALGTLIVYQDHPLSMDEYAAYFQSRVFAAGRLSGRFPVELLDWLIPRMCHAQLAA
jgi:hypothetical protein